MKRPGQQGFSLIEVLMVMVILALLFTISVPTYTWLRDRAAFAGCVSNLRILHVGFNNYMQEHDMIWPQLPGGPDMQFGNEEAEWEWWYKTLKDYDVGITHWICPADKPTGNSGTDKNSDTYRSSYVPTAFDEFPNTAFKWKQPWVIERGGFHYRDKGPNLLMPDGTVQQGPAFTQR